MYILEIRVEGALALEYANSYENCLCIWILCTISRKKREPYTNSNANNYRNVTGTSCLITSIV